MDHNMVKLWVIFEKNYFYVFKSTIPEKISSIIFENFRSETRRKLA